MEKKHIFYSWQSDLPNRTNRSFIEAALEKAIKLLAADDEMEIEPVLDRDTLNEPGAIHIAESVFSKIDRSKVFVGDVSIIGVLPKKRLSGEARSTPNPNVLVELGYALKTLRHTGVLMVMNTAFGSIKDLPFDLDRRRVISYEVSETELNKAPLRQKLSEVLAARIKEVLDYDATTLSEEITPLYLQIADAYASAAEPFRIKQILNKETEIIVEKLNNLSVFEKDALPNTEDLTNFMREAFELTEEFVRSFAFGCYEGNDRYKSVWAEILTRIGELVAPDRRIDEIRFFSALLCFYAGGIAAVAGDKYETLATLIHNPKLRTGQGYSGSFQSPGYSLIPACVIDHDATKRIPEIGRHYTPLNYYLYNVLREPLREVIPNNEAYDEAFLRFEYIFALASMEIYLNNFSSLAAPEGSYTWENWIIRDSTYERSFIWNLTTQEIEQQGEGWLPFHAGVFKMKFSDFKEFKLKADDAIIKYIRNRFPAFTGKPRY